MSDTSRRGYPEGEPIKKASELDNIKAEKDDGFRVATPEEIQEALRSIAESPVKFSIGVLELHPYPYQVGFLEDMSRRICVCAGRQAGKSMITSARALWFAITRKMTNTLIISATQRQSILMFNKILGFVQTKSILRNAVVRKTRTEIVFTNGSEIHALPCGDGNSLRGYTANQIIVDEAAFVPDEVITQSAMPMLATTEGTMIMISTPYMKNHVFFRSFTSPEFSKYRFVSADNPRVSKEYLDEQLELVGESRFRQEFLAEFVDDDRTFFPMDLLKSCVHACESTPCEYCDIISGKSVPSGDLYAGYDPGGMRDPAGLVVVQRTSVAGADGKKQLKFRVVLSRTFVAPRGNEAKTPGVYTQFTVLVSDIHKKMHFKKMNVDSTGLGSPIVEHCKELKLPAEGVVLGAKTKEELLSNVRILLEQKRIVLPNDMQLLANLNCIDADRTRNSGYTFGHDTGTHDDLAFALALALRAARNAPFMVAMTDDYSEPVDYRQDRAEYRYSRS